MRRPRVLLLLTAVGLAGLLAAGSGCGVIADDTAATVDGTVIPASLVNRLAGDTQFRRALTAQADEDQRAGIVQGDSARQVLTFLIQTEALSREVHRWGVRPTGNDLEQAKAAAEAQIDEQAPDLEGKARDVVLRYLVDGTALQDRFTDLDPSSEEDLRLLYDGIPSYWDQVCMDAVVVPADGVAKARGLLAGGTELADLPDEIDSSSVVATSEQCLPLAYLPEELRDRVEGARIDVLTGPVENAIEGQDSVVWFRVESKGRTSFEDAQDQLQQLAQAIVQQGISVWLTTVVNENVTIDPQYGSGATVSSNGLTVLAPATPLGTPNPAGSLEDVTAGAAGATP